MACLRCRPRAGPVRVGSADRGESPRALLARQAQRSGSFRAGAAGGAGGRHAGKKAPGEARIPRLQGQVVRVVGQRGGMGHGQIIRRRLVIAGRFRTCALSLSARRWKPCARYFYSLNMRTQRYGSISVFLRMFVRIAVKLEATIDRSLADKPCWTDSYAASKEQRGMRASSSCIVSFANAVS